MFTDLEKKVLEVFVTSADDKIYAINSNVPPEVFGAFGSYFSRNPKDFREHLLDAIKGQIDSEETKADEEKESYKFEAEDNEEAKKLAEEHRFDIGRELFSPTIMLEFLVQIGENLINNEEATV